MLPSLRCMSREYTTRRELWVQRQIIGILGVRQWRNIAADLTPLHDGEQASVVYDRGRPVYASGAAVHMLGLRDRLDFDAMPPVDVDLDELPHEPDRPAPARASFGRVTLLSAGEPETIRHLPIRRDDLKALYSLPKWQLQFCIRRASRTSNRGFVFAHIDGRVSPNSMLSQALGFNAFEMSWVPDRWHARVPAGVVESGFEMLIDGADEPTVLEWRRMSFPDGNVTAYSAAIMTSGGEQFAGLDDMSKVVSVPAFAG